LKIKGLKQVFPGLFQKSSQTAGRRQAGWRFAKIRIGSRGVKEPAFSV
jgi:hypothetical protein